MLLLLRTIGLGQLVPGFSPFEWHILRWVANHELLDLFLQFSDYLKTFHRRIKTLATSTSFQ
jgi:hypothetical protein